MKSARLSNIELLRIVAMVMILILHANGALGPFVAVDNTDTPTASFIRLLIEQTCIVSVNVFVMIS